MPAPEIIHQLVERFERNRSAYLASAYTPSVKDRLRREVESTDRGIDGLVASRELYGLPETEIRIVEAK